MSSGPHASDSDSPSFLVRWRGRSEGPYTATAIEAKLAANQLGMLHEILRDGQWVTLRDYFAERDDVLRAQSQAREERERHTREALERQAREREEEQRLSTLAETNRSIELQAAPAGPPQSTSLIGSLYRTLLQGVCVVSLLAFFLPNVTISVPVLGTVEASMFDFLTTRKSQSSPSPDRAQKPSVENVSKLRFSNLTLGGALCVASLLGLLLHYLSTVAWAILAFAFRKTNSAFNLVWLSLGLQFPLLFSIGVHMTLAGVRTGVAQQPGGPDSDVGTLFGLALVNNTSIGPGAVMWVLMTLASLAVGISALQQPSRA